jgi:hypothetical protein
VIAIASVALRSGKSSLATIQATSTLVPARKQAATLRAIPYTG